MTKLNDVLIEDRIKQLMDHLGIRRAHFAAKVPRDWVGLAANYPDAISSLTLVCPRGMPLQAATPFADRLLIILGDTGNQAHQISGALAQLPDARSVVLEDYLNVSWCDALAERGEEIIPAMTDFLSSGKRNDADVSLSFEEGECAEISYRIQGSGPPLVLLPLSLAQSQWEPALHQLSEHFTAIVLGGPHLGIVPELEARVTGPYASLRNSLVNELRLHPGETILDVGCGTGVHDRWLVRHTDGANPITAIDINPYLLQEATSLARKEGVDAAINFQQGDATSLPFEDESFDVAMSITVIEEVNADRLLAEMVRVTRPGGLIGIACRSMDLPSVIHLPLDPELKAKIEAPGFGGGGATELGCADTSLYRRVQQLGLRDVKMIPQLGVATEEANLRVFEGNIVASLDNTETEHWRAAVAQAKSEGTYFIARPYHCAVGTKPRR